jgi:mevalonate kinase
MIKVSAPGKLILIGEYFVLQDQGIAVSFAINRRMSIKLQKREDSLVTVKSDFGCAVIDGVNLIHDSSFFNNHNFTPLKDPHILIFQNIIKKYSQKSIDIIIESEINPNFGFGSSAALATSLTAAIMLLNDQSFVIEKNRHKIALEAINLIRETYNKNSSGVDVATSVFGSIIKYNKYAQHFLNCTENLVENLDNPFKDLSILAIYSGYKLKSQFAINRVSLSNSIIEKMSKGVNDAISAIKAGEKHNLWYNLNLYQEYLKDIGVSDYTIDKIVDIARKYSLAAKISGSGLGDCVLVLTQQYQVQNIIKELKEFKVFELQIESEGVRRE